MYRFYQWMAFFYIYCVCGWIWETSYVSVCQKRFVNRGFLHGPMIPLYGSGAVAMLVLALPVKDDLLLTYIVGVVGATLLELVTGWGMETIFKVRYWDYSRHRLQFHGYICLSSSLFWGVLTILLVRVIHEPVERFVLGQPDWLVIAAVSIITVLFVLDLAVSAKEALDLRKILVALEKIRVDMEQVQAEINARLEESRAQVSERLEEGRAQVSARLEEGRAQAAEFGARLEEGRAQLADLLEQGRQQAAERMEESRAQAIKQLEQTMAALKEKREIELGEFHLAHRKLRRRHPSATTGRLEELLTDMKKKMEERQADSDGLRDIPPKNSEKE